MEKKLYFTVIMTMIIGSWNMVQAKDNSISLINNTPDTIYVQIDYKKDGHSTKQGRQVTIPAGQTVNGTWVDSFQDIYASNMGAIPVNSDGAFRNSSQRPASMITIPKIISTNSGKQPITFTKNQDGTLSGTSIISFPYTS